MIFQKGIAISLEGRHLVLTLLASIFIYSKCKFNVDLYWIIKNVIIYCKYALKFSIFEVIYYIIL